MDEDPMSREPRLVNLTRDRAARQWVFGEAWISGGCQMGGVRRSETLGGKSDFFKHPLFLVKKGFRLGPSASAS